MTVKLFGLEFKDEEDRDRALRELQEALDRITKAERQAWNRVNQRGMHLDPADPT